MDLWTYVIVLMVAAFLLLIAGNMGVAEGRRDKIAKRYRRIGLRHGVATYLEAVQRPIDELVHRAMEGQVDPAFAAALSNTMRSLASQVWIATGLPPLDETDHEDSAPIVPRTGHEQDQANGAATLAANDGQAAAQAALDRAVADAIERGESDEPTLRALVWLKTLRVDRG